MTYEWLCIGCGGVYTDQMADGGTYHHVCAPLPPDEFGVQLLRKGHRDENRVTTRAGYFTGIVAEGAGVSCLGNKQLTEPQWLMAARARRDKEEEQDA